MKTREPYLGVFLVFVIIHLPQETKSGLSSLDVDLQPPDLFIGLEDKILQSECSVKKSVTATNTIKKISFQLRVAKKDFEFVDEDYVTLLPSEHNVTHGILRYPMTNFDEKTEMATLKCCVQLQPSDTKTALGKIIIGRRPQKPHIIRTEVYNWSHLLFDWQPQKQGINTVFTTDTDAYWRSIPLQREGQWKKCPSIAGHPGRCIIREHFVADSLYEVKVTATNRLGNVTSDLEHIDAAMIVKPSAICTDCIKVNKSSSTEMLVEIKAPTDMSKNLLYQVKYQCKFDKTPKEMNMTSSQSPLVRLQGLYAGQNYQLTVRTIPAPYGGYWSETTTASMTTEDDVPGVAPPVFAGCYEIVEKDKNRDVIIHWKRVPERQANGRITSHKIEIITKMIQIKSVAADKYWIRLRNLKKDTDYGITVNAVTSKGANDSLKLQVITIPSVSSYNSLPSPPDTVSVIKISSKQRVIMWIPVGGATSYTILWCELAQYADVCEGPSNWKQVDGRQNEVLLSVDDPVRTYKFAVSSQKNGASSGLVWNNPCLYEAQNEPTIPEIKELKVQGSTSISVTLQDRMNPCYGNQAYIVSYNITVTRKPAEDAHTCSDKSVKTAAVASGLKEYIITGLTAGHTYCFKVVSVAYGGKHASSIPSEHTMKYLPKSVPSDGEIVGIGFGCAFLIILFVVGLITCCRYCRRKAREAKEKMKVSITVPGRLDNPMDSAGYTLMDEKSPSPTEATILTEMGLKTSVEVKENEYNEESTLNGAQDQDKTAESKALTNGIGPPVAALPLDRESSEEDEEEYTNTTCLLSEVGGDPLEPVAPMFSGPGSDVPVVSLHHGDELKRILQLPAAPIKVDIDETLTSAGDTGTSQPASSGGFVTVTPGTFDVHDDILKTPAAPIHSHSGSYPAGFMQRQRSTSALQEAADVIAASENVVTQPKVPGNTSGHVLFPSGQPVSLVNYEDSGTCESECYTATRDLLCEMGGTSGLASIPAPTSTLQAFQPSEEVLELLRSPAAPIQMDCSDEHPDAVTDEDSDGYAVTSVTREDLVSPVSLELGPAADHLAHVNTEEGENDKCDTIEEQQMLSVVCPESMDIKAEGSDDTVVRSDTCSPQCGSKTHKCSAIFDNDKNCSGTSNAAQEPLHHMTNAQQGEDHREFLHCTLSVSDGEDNRDYSSANFTAGSPCV